MQKEVMKKLSQTLYTTTFPKCVAIGKNYADHAKEMKGAVPTEPMLFTKPLTSIMRSGETLKIKKREGKYHEIHHEVELGVMIGKKAKYVKAEDYDNYIEGYFVGIDFTDRDLQGQFKKDGAPWTVAKG